MNAFHLLSWTSCPCIKTTSSSVHDPTLFYLLKDISLFPYWQFPPLFWVIPVDIQISPIKTEQKQNTKQSAWLHLPGQSLFHFLTIIPTFFEVLLLTSYSALPSSLKPTPFRLLSQPLFRGTYWSLPCNFGNFCITKSNGQFSVHTFFYSSGAFGTIVTLFETFNSLGLHYSLLFCLSSYIPGAPAQFSLRVLWSALRTHSSKLSCFCLYPQMILFIIFHHCSDIPQLRMAAQYIQLSSRYYVWLPKDHFKFNIVWYYTLYFSLKTALRPAIPFPS